MTPVVKATIDSLRARRKLIGVSLMELARAAKLSNGSALDPGPEELGRLDLALCVLEAGGTIHEARNVVESAKTAAEPEPELPDPILFQDVETHDGGLWRHDRPATVVLRKSP